MDPDLCALYEWVDTFTFSRKKRSFGRDFADAFAAVELLQALWPGVVSTRAFSPANSLAGRTYNWNAVRTRALTRLGIPATQADVEAVAAVQPGAAEWVLALIKRRAEEGGTDPPPPPPSASPRPPPAWVGATPSPAAPRAPSSPAYSAGSAGRAGGPAAAWVRSRLAAAAACASPPPPALPSDHLVRRRAVATPAAPSPWVAPVGVRGACASTPSSSAAAGGNGAAAPAAAAAAAAEVARLRAALRRLEKVALLQEARIEALTARLARHGGAAATAAPPCAHCGAWGAPAAGGPPAPAARWAGEDAECVPPPAAGEEESWGSGGRDENAASPPRDQDQCQSHHHEVSGCGGGLTPPGRARACMQRPSPVGWVAAAPPPGPAFVPAGTPGPLASSWAARPAAQPVHHHRHGQRWW